jgi:VCBS repeat-containing protein
VSYKNGEWKYSDKDSGTIYQLTTTGDGTAKWAVCLSVADLGYMHVTIPLKLKNNKLVLASETLSGDVLETGCSGGVNKTMTVYTAAGGNKTAFTATKGNVVEFVSYKIIGNKVYVQVKNEEGKLGWIGEKQFACIEFDGVLQ